AAPAARRRGGRQARRAGLSSAATGCRGPSSRLVGRRRGEDLEEELLVELLDLALGAGEQEVVGHGHERAIVAGGVLDERTLELRRHELVVAGLLEAVAQTLAELLARGGVHDELDAEPALERQELGLAQLVLEAPVAGEDHGQDRA